MMRKGRQLLWRPFFGCSDHLRTFPLALLSAAGGRRGSASTPARAVLEVEDYTGHRSDAVKIVRFGLKHQKDTAVARQPCKTHILRANFSAEAINQNFMIRSEDTRFVKGCVRTCKIRGSP